MMNEELDKLWNDYVSAENDRIRPVLLESLDRFLSKLKEHPADVWTDWVYEIAEKHCDKEDTFPIRMPLFQNAIFPILFAGYSAGKPNCARWLAGFNQLIYHCPECQKMFEEDGWSERALLWKALDHEPDDSLARARLIKDLAWSLDYSLHELPAAVLYGNDGASVEQCAELNETLEAFASLIAKQGETDKYSELVSDCRFHYRHYGEYLTVRANYQSYEEYLQKR